MTRILFFYFALICSFAVSAQGVEPLGDLFGEQPEFLPVDEAFSFDFNQQGNKVTLTWDIADGYYLYKKQLKAVTKGAELGAPEYPEAKQIEDEYFGVSDVFYQQLALTYPIVSAEADGSIKIRYQGCAEAGLCYPPTTKVVYLNQVSADDGAGASGAAPASTANADVPVSEQFQLVDMLTNNDSLALTLLAFLALGVGLAFTPCVFPMYPILSGIVIGQGNSISTPRAFSLSFIYVQGMAITYSLLGLVVASAGVQFQAALQHPAILITLIVIFVALAFVMFGAYELQLPVSWQTRLNELSQQQKSGSYVGVFMMGAISGLVASPCTTAPLTGILLYIAQSGDTFLGFTALYALSLGMGIPLILFGITGGKLLPKAGNWMNIVKAGFGFMLLVVALVFVERMVSNLYIELLWSALGLITFSYFYVMNQGSDTTFWKGVRALIIFLGLFTSAMYGYRQLFPATVVSGAATQGHEVAMAGHPKFTVVRDLDDFDEKLQAANSEGKSVMIDLYADWCVACKEFEKYTFTDAGVQDALSNTVWMQIDLTDPSVQSLTFQDHFGVLGLPTIMFFDAQGNELESARVTGFMKADPFEAHVRAALGKP